jgi:hypothetical protein
MDELERFKTEISLADVAQAHGYGLDRRESSRSSLVLRHANGDKIVIATDAADGHGIYFSVRDPADHGSVIDFVQRRRGLNLGQARKALREWLSVPSSFPTAPTRHFRIPRPEPISRDRAALAIQWQRMSPYAGGYLEGRGLAPATLAAFADRIRTDERGNAVFRHDDLSGLSGWEIKNRGFTGFAAGGRKALFGVRAGIPSQADPPRIVVTESAIDALSFHQIDSAPALLLSFAGSLSPEQGELLRFVLAKYPAAEVLAAMDADAQGDEFALLIRSLRPDACRVRPAQGKDWNDVIRLSATLVADNRGKSSGIANTCPEKGL